MRVTRTRTNRPRGALLQLATERGSEMRRIGGRLRTRTPGFGGANVEIPLFSGLLSNLCSSRGTVAGGQLAWAGLLPKSSGGAQRSPQGGWKSPAARIGIRGLDCEAYKPSRDESRAKRSHGSVWKGRGLTDISWPGDNRLILPKRSQRRQGLAPRCRLVASWGWSRSQGSGCSPVKAARELGSERRETVRPLSGVGVGELRGAVPSTRGPGWA